MDLFFISLLKMEGFVGLYNCYCTLPSNLSHLKQFKCEAVSYFAVTSPEAGSSSLPKIVSKMDDSRRLSHDVT